MGLLEGAHIAAQFRLPEPQRHLALEHAALAPLAACERALARDDKDESRAVALCPAQKSQQLGMGLRLGLAVEIESRVDGRDAARKPLLLPPLDRLDLRRGLLNG